MSGQQSDRSRICQIASNTRWAKELDRAAATAPGTDAFMAKFEREVDPNSELTPEVRAVRAAQLRRAYMQGLARRSAQSRAEKAAARKTSRRAS
jgi:arylamine N-acetyltransferase